MKTDDTKHTAASGMSQIHSSLQFIFEALRNSWLPRAFTFLFQAHKTVAFPYRFARFVLRYLISIDF